MVRCSLAASRSDARRLIEGGGVAINGKEVRDVLFAVDRESLRQGVIIRKGKKVFHRIILG